MASLRPLSAHWIALCGLIEPQEIFKHDKTHFVRNCCTWLDLADENFGFFYETFGIEMCTEIGWLIKTNKVKKRNWCKKWVSFCGIKRKTSKKRLISKCLNFLLKNKTLNTPSTINFLLTKNRFISAFFLFFIFF